jgi:hypothetical protein
MTLRLHVETFNASFIKYTHFNKISSPGNKTEIFTNSSAARYF